MKAFLETLKQSGVPFRVLLGATVRTVTIVSLTDDRVTLAEQGGSTKYTTHPNNVVVEHS